MKGKMMSIITVLRARQIGIEDGNNKTKKKKKKEWNVHGVNGKYGKSQ